VLVVDREALATGLTLLPKGCRVPAQEEQILTLSCANRPSPGLVRLSQILRLMARIRPDPVQIE
jgi:hypothetical protein